MRATILYVLGAYPLWSETFIRQDLKLLLRLGVPLKPIALFSGDIERQGDWPEVTCLERASRDTPSAASPLRTAATVFGNRWLPRALRTRLAVLRHRRLRRTVGEIALQEGIRHIHAEFADLPALLTASLARSRGLTYSVSVHARDVHLGKFDPGFLFGRASFVTACNTMALNTVLADYPDVLDRTHLIYHGLELEDWPFRFEERAPAAKPRLAFVGRFVPKKGLSALFDALALLRDSGRPADVDLVGSGPLEAQLRRQAAAHGIDSDVRWHGILPRQEVRRVIADADALVMPSIVDDRGDRDGIPNVVLEAMALGTPVVGTQAGSLPEVLTQHTGWTAKAGNAASLAQSIIEFEDGGSLVEQRRREARSLIEENFNAEKLALQRANLFDQLGLNSAKS